MKTDRSRMAQGIHLAGAACLVTAAFACASPSPDPNPSTEPPVNASCTTPASEDFDALINDANENRPPGGGPPGGGPPPGAGGVGGFIGSGGGPSGPPGSEGDGGGGREVRGPRPVANEYGEGENGFSGLSVISGLPNAFGTNGRHCESCHHNEGGWSLRPENVVERFETGLAFSEIFPRHATNEDAATNDDLEPLFRVVDGTNSPLADVSTPAARLEAYSMLLHRAVFRTRLPVPDDAELELVDVDDPYGFASSSELSLFRRPSHMANLRFNTSVMWDGRETEPCEPLSADLGALANTATLGHAEAAEELSADDRAMIAAEQLSIYFAQTKDSAAGRLDADGARGGPALLVELPFHVGMNAFERTDPEGRPYSPEAFDLYRAWRDLTPDTPQNQARVRIAAGEHLFNTREFMVRGVSGFNDELGRAEVVATCTSCHNTPNVGTNSEGRLMDIGVSDASRRTAELPLYTFREKSSGALVKTTDPGRALISGRWADMNRFKVPGLRGLAVRRPYLHDGSAATIAAAVDHHDQRFGIGLDSSEKAALVAFLSAL
ncbi:hypothetical protein WME91_03415 [Sorangium sp. So ce269]